GQFTDGRWFLTTVPDDPALFGKLVGKGVSISVQRTAAALDFTPMLVSWLPFIALIGVWIYLSKWKGSIVGTFGGSAGGVTGPTGPRNETDALKRQIADLQRQIDELKTRIR